MSLLKGKNVLITGSSGFLGSHLAEYAFKEGAILYGVDIKPPLNEEFWKGIIVGGVSSPELEILLKREKFEVIFHLAGGASVAASIQNPMLDFTLLIPDTYKLLYLLKQYNPTAHFVFFSSAAVYGNPKELPIKETAPISPISPYGINKALTEKMVEYYTSYWSIRSSVLRIFSAYGEGLRKQLFWDVMNKYKSQLANVLTDNDIMVLSLFGTGKESRDFIYCKDVVRAAILVSSEQPLPGNTEYYNVANGEQVPIEKAMITLFANAEIKTKFDFTGSLRSGDPECWVADISKLSNLGYLRKHEFNETLDAYFKWFTNHSM